MNEFSFGAPQLKRDPLGDRKSTRLNSSHSQISYAVFCLKKKKINPYLVIAHVASQPGALLHSFTRAYAVILVRYLGLAGHSLGAPAVIVVPHSVLPRTPV